MEIFYFQEHAAALHDAGLTLPTVGSNIFHNTCMTGALLNAEQAFPRREEAQTLGGTQEISGDKAGVRDVEQVLMSSEVDPKRTKESS
ncbi:hypothetical protein FQA47_012601 [Oryzias melastigma]|uniref:Uncharacterized protein n=1 Tax=Oryzias melastigma TaxID=30732 RepID=A0A834C4Z8_ORYME|nr:hypothetical protein FQA47_012601 [Oryzias melastigma]